MNIKYTTSTLKKLEQLFEEARYRIRFEKGQFHSGYCVLEDKKVAVINKFLDIEGRINALVEIVPTIRFNEEELSGEMQKFLKQIMPLAIPKNDNNQQVKINFEDDKEPSLEKKQRS